MNTETKTETHGFQAEVQQLLHLMIHSLYSNKEIFLRELISNASDAADKLRFEAVSNPELLEDDPELAIRIEFDADAGTISVSDNGIGMSHDEVISNLGTIARSGTAEFLSQISGDDKKDARLIGQFGVGFYSSFIVADRVEVTTRRAGQPADEGVRWVSEGKGEFTVEPVDRPARGTTVTLHLKSDSGEYAEDFRIRSIVRKYSDHIAFPVLMPVAVPQPEGDEADGDDEATVSPRHEPVNTAKALWTRPRTDISDEEYVEFYKHIAHDFQDPLLWSHNRVEGKREYTTLLYLPAHPPFDLWNRESPRGLKLYVQRVFIMDDAEQFLPLYLRFVRGVVDSGDLSLNVSREILQQDATVDAIRAAVSKRVLGMLEKLSKDEPEKYQSFWQEFGRVLKEGPAEDRGNKEQIAGLLRFASTHSGSETQDQSLAGYVARMKEGQDKIYYITADTHAAAKSSPQLEIFRDKSIEVLLLGDPIDEWLMNHLGEFDGKELRDVRRGELDLGAVGEKGSKDSSGESADDEQHKAFLDRLREVLKDSVEDVRVTHRLTESPACLAIGEFDVGVQMRRIMEASGQPVPEARPVFEVNPEHPLIERLNGEADDGRFEELARIVFDQAKLAEGQSLEEPGLYVKRLNKLLLEMAG